MSKRPSSLSPRRRATGTRLRCEQLEDRAVPSAGDLDLTFSGDGLAMVSNHSGPDVAIQADGKVVVAGGTSGGSANFRVSRLNTDGAVDSTFGSGGTATTDFNGATDRGRAMAIQANEKIVVAGTAEIKVKKNWFTRNGLVRYNSNGSLDSTFGSGGKVLTENTGGAYDIAIDSAGKIVTVGISGTGDMQICRYNANGSLDSSFGSGGKVAVDFFGQADGAHSVALQPDGKIVVSGWGQEPGAIGHTAKAVLVRLNSNGTFDNTFDGDGKLFAEEFSAANNPSWATNPSVALQNDDGELKILLGGGDGPGGIGVSDFLLARYNSDGSLDTGFGTNGFSQSGFNTAPNELNALAVLADGRIIAAGSSASPTSGLSRYAVARYSADGVLDLTFGTDGLVAFQVDPSWGGSFEAIATQSDGKVVASGFNHSTQQCLVARFLGDEESGGGGGGGGTAMMPAAPSDTAQKSFAPIGLDGSSSLFGRFIFDPTLDTLKDIDPLNN